VEGHWQVHPNALNIDLFEAGAHRGAGQAMSGGSAEPLQSQHE
jgi:hypothetical protein